MKLLFLILLTGITCSVFSQGPPSINPSFAPRLRNADCARQGFVPTYPLYANLTGGLEYEFEVTSLDLGITEIISSTDRRFSISEAPNISRYNATYEVRVRMKVQQGQNPNGVWTQYGQVCTVKTFSIKSDVQGPCPKVLSDFNQQMRSNASTGSSYIFEIRKTNNPTVTEQLISPDRFFYLSEFSNIFQEFSTSYQIRMTYLLNGVWQEFGNWCEIITPLDPNVDNALLHVYASAGNDTIVAEANIHLSYTIGEVIVEHYSHFNQGFQQSFPLIAVPPNPSDMVLGPHIKFDIFPNPFSEKVYLSPQTDDSNSYAVTVFNGFGAVIKELDLGPERLEIDLQGQPQGIYFIKISNSDGSLMESFRIVKSSEIN